MASCRGDMGSIMLRFRKVRLYAKKKKKTFPTLDTCFDYLNYSK